MKLILSLTILIFTLSSISFAEQRSKQKGDGAQVEPVTTKAKKNQDSKLEAAIKRGVDFLVTHQNKDGSWGGPTRTKGLNIYAPLPEGLQAFHAASSSLALQGLIESQDRRPAVVAAIDKGEKWLLKNLPLSRSIDPNAMYNVWAHSYGLHALSALYRYHQDPVKRALYIKLAKQQIAKLQRYEDVNGGWGYLDFDGHYAKPTGMSTCFVTSAALLAMKDAHDTMGVALPPVLIKRAVRSVQLQRVSDFSYIYARPHRFRPRIPINRPAGSLGRSQVCNAATRAFGDKKVTDEVLKTWLKRLFDRNGWLDHGRKRPIPHEAPAKVAGYFYYFGHYYAMTCIEMLPKDEQSVWKKKLADLLISKQEKNGSWWDYPLYNYHYAYGTGFVLTILSHCRP